MSLKLKGGRVAPLAQAALNIGQFINTQGDDFVSQTSTQQLVSMESIDGLQANKLQSNFENVRAQLKRQLGDIKGLGFENVTDADEIRRQDSMLDAGAMAAMAAGDPEAYARAAYTNAPQADAGVKLIDSMADAQPGMDYRQNASMEAYNDKELREHLPFSILFNVYASRQDDFSEMFFPTTVVPPDQAGLDMTVARMQVFHEQRHKASGAKADFGKRNLIDAQIDHTILADETTKLVPVFMDDGGNADKFLDEAVFAPFNVSVQGFQVPTSALIVDEDIDLLGISQYQPLIGAGVIDHSDDVDARITLDHLFLQTAADAKVVAFPVSRLARASFNKTVEGNSRLVGLQFTNSDLVVTKDTRAADKSVVDAFAGIVTGEYSVRLAVNVSGELNVETGNIKVWAAGVKVHSITDKNGNSIPLGTGAGAAVVASLKDTKVAGYTLIANRTNANLRTRGHLLDTVYETARYTIPLGSPISITSPVNNPNNRDAADQKALIAAVRTRNSNNALTALFAIAEQLKEATKGPKLASGEDTGIGGLGRFLVDPFFEEHNLDLVESMNSLRSQDRPADISTVLVSAIRDVAYRMYQLSKIQPAIDAVTGTAGNAPVLQVGTDQVLIRHILVNGDSRTFGTVFDKAVVKASTDRRMYGKIVISMAFADADGPHPLTFGTHAWISELISLMPVSRNGQVSKEATVQPRTLHINNSPILAIINVRGLSKALVDKTAQPYQPTSATTNVYLAGLRAPTL